MSEIINELATLAEQARNVHNVSIEDGKNYAGYVAMFAPPLYIAVKAGVDYFRDPIKNESTNSVSGGDLDILDEVVTDKTGRARARAKKWGAPALAALGVTTYAMTLLDPQLEYTEAVPGVEFVTVIDQSYSMQFTRDMDSDNQTRLEVVNDVTNTVTGELSDESNSGIILFGENVDVVAPLSTERPDLNDVLNTSNILQNGADAVSALELADNLLDGASNTGSESILFYTDGTVDNPDATAETIRTITESGKNVAIVVTGTEGSEAEYIRSGFDVTPIPSAVKSEAFLGLDDLENVTVIESDSKDEIVGELIQDVNKKTKTTQKRPYTLQKYVGGLMIGLGSRGTIRQFSNEFRVKNKKRKS